MKYLNVSREIFLNGKKVNSMKKKRRIYFSIAFAAILLSEILIGMYASGWIRNSFGDILVMPAMYFLIRSFTDKFKKTLPYILFIFACTVEFLQYLDICGILGIRKGSLLSVIIGTHGCFGDILCYGAGTIIICIISHLERRHKND